MLWTKNNITYGAIKFIWIFFCFILDQKKQHTFIYIADIWMLLLAEIVEFFTRKKAMKAWKDFMNERKKKILAIYTFIWITSVCVFVRTHVWQEYIIIVVIFFSLCAFVQKNLNQPFLYVCLKIWKRARERDIHTVIFSMK